jgi:hypothetical protein
MSKSCRMIGGLIGIAILTGCNLVESPSPTELPTPTHQTETPVAPSPTSITPTRQWTAVPISPTQVPRTDGPATPAIPATADPVWHDQIAQAEQDLARRLSLDVDQIELVEVQAVVWPDGAMGCPQPGMVYTQLQQDGLLIRLRVGKVTYNYHSGGSRGPFLCEKPAAGDNPLPPPGGPIDK